MKGRKAAVGVFDSGIGGLTVLKNCAEVFPLAQYYYLGDNQNAPYGERSEDEIFCFTDRCVKKLIRKKVSAVVLACNTATAVCIARLRVKYPDVAFIGTEPAVLPAVRKGGNILVLCTPKTAHSQRLCGLIQRVPDAKITVYACCNLAKEVEDCVANSRTIDLSSHLPCGTFDGVVLGCTHYVWLKEKIQAFYSSPVYDGNEGVARRLKEVFLEKLGTNDHLFPQEGKEKDEKNKCLQKKRKKGVKFPIFLGKSRKTNKNIYKQMFVS